MLGFGSTYPGENTWNKTLHAGTGRIDGVYDHEMWVFGDTSPSRTTVPVRHPARGPGGTYARSSTLERLGYRVLRGTMPVGPRLPASLP